MKREDLFKYCKNCRNTMSGSPDPCSDWCDACLSDDDEYGYEPIEKENPFEFKVPSTPKYEEVTNIDFLTFRV